MKRTIFFLTGAWAIGAAQLSIAQDSSSASDTPSGAPVRAGTPAAAHAMAHPDVVTVRNVTRAELVAGIPIVQEDGKTIGTIAQLAGNDVILTDGASEYRIDITQIYAFSRDGADWFASRIDSSALRAMAADEQGRVGRSRN